MIWEYILDLLFPNRCPCCDELIPWNKLLCTECIGKLNELRTDTCGKFNGDGEFVCFYYDGKARDGIISLKNSSSKNFGKYLGEQLGNKILDTLKNETIDYVIPVPSSRDRIRKRGYNQALTIAEAISGVTGIKVNNNILHKIKTEYQHSLSAEKRAVNVSAITIVKETDLSGMNIVICDDVTTTGSTVNRCAELLKNMGAAKIYAAVGTTTKLEKRKD